MTEKNLVNLKDVSETLLIPLYIRAKETQRPDAILKDEKAVAMVKQINYDFSRIKLAGHDELGIILRVREFDRFVRNFLDRHPESTVVHIGCGLDTRFWRWRLNDSGCGWMSAAPCRASDSAPSCIASP